MNIKKYILIIASILILFIIIIISSKVKIKNETKNTNTEITLNEKNYNVDENTGEYVLFDDYGNEIGRGDSVSEIRTYLIDPDYDPKNLGVDSTFNENYE